jgi:hypothetical protein
MSEQVVITAEASIEEAAEKLAGSDGRASELLRELIASIRKNVVNLELANTRIKAMLVGLGQRCISGPRIPQLLSFSEKYSEPGEVYVIVENLLVALEREYLSESELEEALKVDPNPNAVSVVVATLGMFEM